MKIQAFHAKDGDCLLIRGDGDTVILADGGRSTPFEANVARVLHDLDTDIDLVYVSHIDDDHISGILKLVRTEIAWRVHDYLSDDPDYIGKPPKIKRPAAMANIWHNGFAELVDDSDGKIYQALENTTRTLALSPTLVDLRDLYENLTTGVASALELNYRLQFSHLDQLLNNPSQRDDRLLVLSDAQEQHTVGEFTLSVLGPTVQTLEELRLDWNKWLDDNELDVGALRAAAEEEAGNLGIGQEEALLRVLLKEAEALGEGSDDVSEPNVASLTLLVDDGARKILLTGDARSEELLAGLRAQGLITDDQGLHVDVLKVQHHGAAGNVTEEFCRLVTADHYIFCANGAHTNPEKVVLDGFLDHRIGAKVAECLSPVADDRPFTFWFTTHSETKGITKNQRTYLQSVEAHLDANWSDDPGQFSREYPDSAVKPVAVVIEL